jgi:enamine deaminase RidA (YjgF/YER057c/UK114 family)
MTPPSHQQRVDSGTHWEALAGYSRAVRIGNQILVSGTTATGPDGALVGGNDPAAQTRYILDKLEAAIEQLGGRLADVVRTRIYVRHVADWEPVARVHGERFATIRPANTLVEARLVGDEYLVEIEAEAIVGAGGEA